MKTRPVGPISNHIVPSSACIDDKDNVHVDTLEVVACTPLLQEHHARMHFARQVAEDSTLEILLEII